MNPNDFSPKISPKFECLVCDVKCSRKSEWKRHLQTIKHNRLINPNKFHQISPIFNVYKCICLKEYKHLSSLCHHKKKCSFIINNNNTDNMNNNSTVLNLIKQNQQLQNHILELSKEKSIIHNTTNNNCINKTKFNINFFLNEQCKDALNITDFVNSLSLQVSDLEKTGKIGYVEGISQIIVQGLRDIDIYKRPLHCSDAKREIIYIKEENKWEKDNEDKDKMKTAIKQISNKNINQIDSWVSLYPECKDYSSTKNEEYLKLISNSMCGVSTEEIKTNYDKIIHNITKEVIIDKD